MRKRFTLLLAVPGLILVTLLTGPMTACGTEESSEDFCGSLYVSGGEPAIDLNCSGTVTSNISNITYDQYGRVIAFDFDIRCSGKHVAGKVYNILRNNLGDALSYDARINGQTCHWP